MFSSALRLRNLKTQQSPVILDLCLKKLGKKNHKIIEESSFPKGPIFEMLSVRTETRSRHF